MMTAYFSSEFVKVRRIQQHLKSTERKTCLFENSVKMPLKNKGETTLFRHIKIERLYHLPNYTTRNVRRIPSGIKKMITDLYKGMKSTGNGTYMVNT